MDDFARLVHEVAELKRQLSQLVRVGTVSEVRGDKVRVDFAKDKDDQDVTGPWMHTTDQRGGARARSHFKRGMNVTVIQPSSDPMQAMVLPFGPNKNYKAPSQANKSGLKEETYQQYYTYNRTTENSHEFWLSEDKESTDPEDSKTVAYMRLGTKPQKDDKEYTLEEQKKGLKEPDKPVGSLYIKLKTSKKIEIGGLTIEATPQHLKFSLGSTTWTLESAKITVDTPELRNDVDKNFLERGATEEYKVEGELEGIAKLATGVFIKGATPAD